jgi:hypothetical protein
LRRGWGPWLFDVVRYVVAANLLVVIVCLLLLMFDLIEGANDTTVGTAIALGLALVFVFGGFALLVHLHDLREDDGPESDEDDPDPW